MIVLPVWKELLQWGPLLLGGAAMGSTVERVLGPCRSWPRRGALYLLLGFTLGCRLVGDHNPILLFLPFLTVFLLCGRGTPSGPAGGWRHLLYAAGPHWDDGGYSAQTGDQQCVAQRGEGGEQSGEAGMLGGAGAGDLEAGAETVRLSSRLWKLLAG